MIVVFSERFNMSKHVDREIEMCIEEGKPILTFKIENVDFKGVKKYWWCCKKYAGLIDCNTISCAQINIHLTIRIITSF